MASASPVEERSGTLQLPREGQGRDVGLDGEEELEEEGRHKRLAVLRHPARHVRRERELLGEKLTGFIERRLTPRPGARETRDYGLGQQKHMTTA